MKKMKSKQLFWGFFFLTLGFLYLLAKFDVFLGFDFSWDLWPLLLILAGIAIITEGTIVRPLISIIFGIFVGFLVFGWIGNVFDENDNFDSVSKGEYAKKTFTLQYDSTITVANLSLKAGAGKFYINDDTNKLIFAKSKGSKLKYTFNDTQKDSIVWIEIESGTKNFKLFNDEPSRFYLKLNQNPVWNLDLELGAAKSELDLSKLKVKNLVLKTGATKTEIKLGDKLPKTYLNIDMGVASLKIKIPHNAGCKIVGKMGLVKKELPGFEENGDGIYKTPDYETAENKIIIDYNGGVSKFEVERY